MFGRGFESLQLHEAKPDADSIGLFASQDPQACLQGPGMQKARHSEAVRRALLQYPPEKGSRARNPFVPRPPQALLQGPGMQKARHSEAVRRALLQYPPEKGSRKRNPFVPRPPQACLQGPGMQKARHSEAVQRAGFGIPTPPPALDCCRGEEESTCDLFVIKQPWHRHMVPGFSHRILFKSTQS